MRSRVGQHHMVTIPNDRAEQIRRLVEVRAQGSDVAGDGAWGRVGAPS